MCSIPRFQISGFQISGRGKSECPNNIIRSSNIKRIRNDFLHRERLKKSRAMNEAADPHCADPARVARGRSRMKEGPEVHSAVRFHFQDV
jgi:hypothetical protein